MPRDRPTLLGVVLGVATSLGCAESHCRQAVDERTRRAARRVFSAAWLLAAVAACRTEVPAPVAPARRATVDGPLRGAPVAHPRRSCPARSLPVMSHCVVADASVPMWAVHDGMLATMAAPEGIRLAVVAADGTLEDVPLEGVPAGAPGAILIERVSGRIDGQLCIELRMGGGGDVEHYRSVGRGAARRWRAAADCRWKDRGIGGHPTVLTIDDAGPGAPSHVVRLDSERGRLLVALRASRHLGTCGAPWCTTRLPGSFSTAPDGTVAVAWYAPDDDTPFEVETWSPGHAGTRVDAFLVGPWRTIDVRARSADDVRLVASGGPEPPAPAAVGLVFDGRAWSDVGFPPDAVGAGLDAAGRWTVVRPETVEVWSREGCLRGRRRGPLIVDGVPTPSSPERDRRLVVTPLPGDAVWLHFQDGTVARSCSDAAPQRRIGAAGR